MNFFLVVIVNLVLRKKGQSQMGLSYKSSNVFAQITINTEINTWNHNCQFHVKSITNLKGEEKNTPHFGRKCHCCCTLMSSRKRRKPAACVVALSSWSLLCLASFKMHQRCFIWEDNWPLLQHGQTFTETNLYMPIIRSFSEQLPVYFPAYLSCHLHCWRHVSLKFPMLADTVLANSVPSSNPELLIQAISLFSVPSACIRTHSEQSKLFIFFSLLLPSLFFSGIMTAWLDINETNIRPRCVHKCCVWLVPQPPLAQSAGSLQVFTASYQDAVTTVSG